MEETRGPKVEIEAGDESKQGRIKRAENISRDC